MHVLNAAVSPSSPEICSHRFLSADSLSTFDSSILAREVIATNVGNNFLHSIGPSSSRR